MDASHVYVRTLRASLSGTLLQTLPDLVTPLKGHYIYVCVYIYIYIYLLIFLNLRAAVQRRGQRPAKGSGTNMTVEATQRQSTHVNMRRIHPS